MNEKEKQDFLEIMFNESHNAFDKTLKYSSDPNLMKNDPDTYSKLFIFHHTKFMDDFISKYNK